MFSITSKQFSFFNHKPPARWVAQITRDFLTCYSCLYYSSMLWDNIWSESFIFYHKTCFSRKAWIYLFWYSAIFKDHVFKVQFSRLSQALKLTSLWSKNICLFKFLWKVCKIKVKKDSTTIAQFFPPLSWLSEMINRDPSGGVKIEKNHSFAIF